MKVSIITVCLNSGATINETLKSVASQTYSDIEYIVIDGFSNDKTIKILSDFKAVIHKLISEPDHGIYDAMNKGLDLATGDLICFLNADDFYASDFVVEQVVKKVKEGQLNVLFGDVVYVRRTDLSSITRRYRSNKFKPSFFSRGWMPAHPATFITRPVVKRVGYFKSNYKIAADFDYMIRIFDDRCIRYEAISEVLVYMRTGGLSDNWKSKFLLNKEILKACRDNGIHSNIIKILSRYPVKLLEYFNHM